MSARKARRRRGVALVALALSGGAVSANADDRSRELVKRDCSSGLGRNELTLFANGTVRLRSWHDEELELKLAELGREELAAYLRRFAEISFRESAGGPPRGVSGEWIERCEFTLTLDDGPPRTFRFGRFDSHDLALATALRIVDELAAFAASRAAAGGLPAGYTPKLGDLLAREDGAEFEIVGFTVVGEGVELRGRIEPLTLYVARDELPLHFVRLLRRAP